MKRILYLKRILCLICIIILQCASLPVIADSSSEKAASDASNFLSVIGLGVNGAEDAVQYEKEVSRAELASNIYKLINEKSVCETLYYHDVSKDDWYFNAVGVLTDRGIFGGNGNNRFNPDETATKEQVIKALVTILGYGPYAELEGGYPSGYLKAAQRIKLSKGVSVSGNLTLGDMYILFENALKINVATGYVENGEYHFLENENDTLLSACYGLHFEEGTLGGCDGININDGSELDENKVLIDNILYDCTEEGLTDLIGCDVDFVYEIKKDNTKAIKWIKSSGLNDIYESPVNYDKYFNESTYELTCEIDNSNKDKALKISKGIKVIYNGEYVGNDVNSIFSLPRYSLRLIKSGNSAYYDIAIIWAYENITVGIKDNISETVYDKFDTSKSISMKKDEYDSLKIYSGNTLTDFSAIDKDMVISCFKSVSGKKMKVSVSENKMTGIVKSVKTIESETTMAIDDREFVFYGKKLNDTPKSGSKIIIYTDFNGFVASTEVSDDREFPAYIIDAALDESGFDSNMKLKILESDGQINTYFCSDKVTADGSKFTDMGALYKHIKIENNNVQQIAIFSLNSEKNIIKIDTVKENSDGEEGLKLYSACVQQRYSSVGKLGTKILIDNNTKIFVNSVPGSTDEKNFMIKGKSDLINSKYYSAEAYRYQKEDLDFEDILVINDSSLSLPVDSAACILVESVGQCIDDDGNTVEFVSGYQGGASVDISAATNSLFSENDICEGDIIRLSYDKEGMASKVELLYDYSSGKRPYTNSGNTISYIDIGESEDVASAKIGSPWVNTFRIVTLYANNIKNNTLYAGYLSGANVDEMFNLASAIILVYDSASEKGRISVGTIADIKSFKNVGDDCSTVFIHTYATNIKTVVVYR